MPVTPKRRWYQFSLKTLLVGMLLLCLGPGGFVAYEQNKARRQKAAVEAIEELGGVVDSGRNGSGRSAMLRQILGDDRFGAVESIDFWNPSRVTDADLIRLACLNRLAWLHLDNSQVTGTGLKHLAGLKTQRNQTSKGVLRVLVSSWFSPSPIRPLAKSHLAFAVPGV